MDAMKITRKKIDINDPASLSGGWINPAGVDATTEADIARHVAEDEAATDSFGIVSAYLNFYPQTTGLQDVAFYLKAENLTNRLGYVHNSFIRDYAPLPGMNIGAGVRITF